MRSARSFSPHSYEFAAYARHETLCTRETYSERGDHTGACYAPAFVRGVRGRVRAMREIVCGMCCRLANVQVHLGTVYGGFPEIVLGTQ
jgi:hypothetical protein